MARDRLDVVLMDYRLPDGTGAEATRAIKARWPGARIVMLTALNDDETMLESIQAGADGYLTKDRAVEDVVSAVRAANAGETLLPRSVIVGIAQRVAAARDRAQDAQADRAAHPARAGRPARADRGALDPRDLRPAVHRPEHAPDPRPEHHGQAPGPLEAGGRRVRPPASARRAAEGWTTRSTEPAGAARRPTVGLSPPSRRWSPSAAHRAVAAPPPLLAALLDAVARRPSPAARGRPSGFWRRSAARRSASRRSGFRNAPQRGQRRSSANSDSSGATV